MSELKQVCIHFMSGNCKYGNTCTKVHISPTTDILQEIEKKGPAICNFYPNCKFTSADCKKLHVDSETPHEKELTELRKLYLKIVTFETTDSYKLSQIERIKYMIKSDLDLVKDTWTCLSECK